MSNNKTASFTVDAGNSGALIAGNIPSVSCQHLLQKWLHDFIYVSSLTAWLLNMFSWINTIGNIRIIMLKRTWFGPVNWHTCYESDATVLTDCKKRDIYMYTLSYLRGKTRYRKWVNQRNLLFFLTPEVGIIGIFM